MAKRQIINGGWQDSLGNPLALGYLTFRLNTDGQSGVQVSAGRLVTVPLDTSGNIAGTVLIWPNDQLIPTGTTYSIIAYTAKGQAVWSSQNFTLPSGGSPYDFSA